MAAFRIDGAAAPGASTPARSDAAREQAGRVGDQGNSQQLDCASVAAEKHIASLTARAAKLGIEADQVGADAWRLRHARGAEVGVVHGLEALEAAVREFEPVTTDVRELVQRLRRRCE